MYFFLGGGTREMNREVANLGQAKQIEKQLMHDRIREGSESGYVQEKRMVIVDGKIRWRKGMKESVASTEGLDGLASWKKELREPSVFYRP